MRVNQFSGVQGRTAIITLVTLCSGSVTVRAGALNIAVRQEALAPGAKGLGCRIFIDIAFIKKGKKNIIHHLSMVSGSGSGE